MCSGRKEELDLGEEGGSLSLKIDTAYARSYEKRKRGEELSKLRDKYGDETESSSCSELEDEFGKGLSTENDKSFLRVLSLIRENSSSLYDPSARFYATESDTSVSEEETGLFLRDYEREKLLREGPHPGDSDSECEGASLAYNPEQRELRRDLLAAATDSNTANDECNVSDFLQPRVKSRAEVVREDTDYSEWLKSNPQTELVKPESLSVELAGDLSHLRGFWSRTDLSEEDRFLRDYLLERRHLGDQGTDGEESSFDDMDLEQLDEADEFERKYNFRFEEDSSSTVARFPRIVLSSVRREDTRRRDQRNTLNERKEREKIQEREEMKRLKNLKKMEIQDKIELIKKITGNQSLGVGNLDFSADFDSEQYDKEMSSIFNQEYLNEKEYIKPDLSPLLPEDLRDSDSDSAAYQLHCEDEGFVMDADCIDEKQHKKYSNNNIPTALPPSSHLKQSLEDYYNIEYQDKIGDLACRMNYRQVVPNSFGLSTEEILTAEDRELNQWASLKKTVQFRSEFEERKDVKRYSKKARNVGKKNRVFFSLYGEDSSNNSTSGRGKLNQNSSKSKLNETPNLTKQQKRILNNNKLSDKQKKTISEMSNTRLKAYNIDPKKGINKRKNISKHKSFV